MIIIYVHFRESGNEGNQGRVIRKSKKDVDKGRKFILNMYLIILHNWICTYITCNRGFPCGLAGKESACNAGDLGSIPGLGRSPGGRERLPTPAFWPGEFHGLYGGHKESDRTERLSLHME